MVIYEVNLSIDSDITEEFSIWLKKHAAEMIQFPGFIEAIILKEEAGCMPEREKLTVLYKLECRNDLQRYFDEFSAKMREEGIRLFSNKFSANRRIFEVQDNIRK